MRAASVCACTCCRIPWSRCRRQRSGPSPSPTGRRCWPRWVPRREPGRDVTAARDDCGPEGGAIDWLTSARLDVDADPVAFQQLATDAGWGDGLPLIPPTEERVRAF